MISSKAASIGAIAQSASQGSASGGAAAAAGPLRRWGEEEDTVAKRADVWSSRQLRAGWEYLLRRAAQIE
jgi:hypothetical protein